jgi:hypothetical protein
VGCGVGLGAPAAAGICACGVIVFFIISPNPLHTRQALSSARLVNDAAWGDVLLGAATAAAAGGSPFPPAAMIVITTAIPAQRYFPEFSEH